MVDRARLESVYRATYRGFESLSLRHYIFSTHEDSRLDYLTVEQFDPALALRGDMFVVGGYQEAGFHGLVDRPDEVHHLIC